MKNTKVLSLSVVILVSVAAMAVVTAGYIFGWPWTGFVSSSSTLNQTTSTYKTLWDWLDLLIVPIALAVTGYVFARWEKDKEQQQAVQKQKRDLDQALDQQREARLQLFLDRMSGLLIEENLQQCELDSPVRAVAQANTMATLRNLDSTRKATLLTFLWDAKLIDASRCIVTLASSDFTSIDLLRTQLVYSDLRSVKFDGAKLRRADFNLSRLFNTMFVEADLTGAQFFQSNVDGARFSKAVLSEASFSESSAIGADFSYATMQMCNFEGATVINGRFVGTNLVGSNFRSANLTGVDFTEADLSSVDFSSAYLFGANFTNARLDGTNFDGAVRINAVGLKSDS